MKSKIKHLAIMSHNAPRLCRFYEALFGLTRARADEGFAKEEEAAKRFGYPVLKSNRVAKPFDSTVIASDGNIGIAFLRRRPGYHAGLDHFGIEVESLDTVVKRYKEKYPSVGVVERPSNRPFASVSSHDPEGNIFDLTQPKMANVRSVWVDGESTQPRYLGQITIRAMNPVALAGFYKDVFELEDVRKSENDPNQYVTDGRTTIVFTPWRIEDYHGMEHRGPGLDHVGFKVENLEDFLSDVTLLAEIDPEWMSQKTPILASEHKTMLRLLSSASQDQHHIVDPDGNFIGVTTH
jgi:catechol 2,3-dioxygenase-like lactoylglutathione lyase family enzyme